MFGHITRTLVRTSLNIAAGAVNRIIDGVERPVMDTIRREHEELAEICNKPSEGSDEQTTSPVTTHHSEPEIDPVQERLDALLTWSETLVCKKGLFISLDAALVFYNRINLIEMQDPELWERTLGEVTLTVKKSNAQKTIASLQAEMTESISLTIVNMRNTFEGNLRRRADENEIDHQGRCQWHRNQSAVTRANWALNVVRRHVIGTPQRELAFLLDSQCLKMLVKLEEIAGHQLIFDLPFDRKNHFVLEKEKRNQLLVEIITLIEETFSDLSLGNRRERAEKALAVYHTEIVEKGLNSRFLNMDEGLKLIYKLKAAKKKGNNKGLSPKEKALKKAKKKAEQEANVEERVKVKMTEIEKHLVAGKKEKAHRLFRQASNDFPDHFTMTWEQFTAPIKAKLEAKKQAEQEVQAASNRKGKHRGKNAA